MELWYTAFGFLIVACTAIQIWVSKSKNDPPIGNNPTFVQFQRKYFIAYFLALFADWLQAPYLYRLYSNYGFQEDQIAILYVCGFASSVILGTWAPVAADKYGRKKLCVVFTIIYSVACLFKLSRNYGILLLGKVLGGIATSLLFSSFESWYIQEHTEKHDFPKEWISVTASKAALWNGILAIIAGIVANILSEWMQFGPVAPFVLAVPCLIASGTMVLLHWDENYAKQQPNFIKSCGLGFREIVTEPKIFVIGIIQSCFESAMYIFIFMWTPVLALSKSVLETFSFGISFSCFMLCIMIGNSVFQICKCNKIQPITVLNISVIMAFAANVMCVIATNPSNRKTNLAFVSFLFIELSVGMYFPSMNVIRNKILPQTQMRSIVNWFKVPLNLLACAALMILHNNGVRHGNLLLFIICSGLLFLASICTLAFSRMVKAVNFNSDLEDS